VLHLDVEADVRHVVGVEVCQRTLLEGRTRNADGALLEIEQALLVDRGERAARVDT
jgi:hypothetical protein